MPSDRLPPGAVRWRPVDGPPAGRILPDGLGLEDPAATERTIVDFVRNEVEGADRDGAVVTLSGGLGSTVTATLAAEALGPENVFGLVLPAADPAEEPLDDPRQVAEELVIDYRVIDVRPMVDAFVPHARSGSGEIDHPDWPQAALDSLVTRFRVAVAAFEAARSNRLLLGAGTRTELALGLRRRFDGVDALPIGHLYETHVRELARHLDVRESIVETSPSASCWAGQPGAFELERSPETIDAVLFDLLEDDRSVEAVASASDLPVEVVGRFDRMVRDAAKARSPPPAPSGTSRLDS